MAGSDRLTEPTQPARGIPEALGRPGPSPFHRLNPLTKATLATVTAVAAVAAFAQHERALFRELFNIIRKPSAGG